MSTGKRLGALALLIAAAVIAFVIASSSGDDDKSDGNGGANRPTATDTAPSGAGTTDGDSKTKPKPAAPAPKATVIRVAGAKPAGGVKDIEVKKGERVRLVVASDVTDEVHIHGYDFSKDVVPGNPARFNFEADIDGVFEIELEDRQEQIASLEVEP